MRLPGGGAVVYSGSSLSVYLHTDWNRDWRLGSSPSRGFEWGRAYGPYGAPYAGNGWLGFTDKWNDDPDGLYEFPARYESPGLKRWLSPDPAGLAAVNPANPQTWDAYTYVDNQPLRNVDPLGLFCPPGGSCTAMDNGAANAAFGFGSESFELAALTMPVIGFTQTGTSVDGGPWQYGPLEPFYTYGFGMQIADAMQAMSLAGYGAPTVGARTDGRPDWVNAITSVFGYDEHDPRPSCFGSVFARTVGNDLNPFAPSRGEVAKGALGAAGAWEFNRALGYAASRGLTEPFKSSVFRSIFGNSEILGGIAEYAPAAGILIALGHGLWDEVGAYRKGACQ